MHRALEVRLGCSSWQCVSRPNKGKGREFRTWQDHRGRAKSTSCPSRESTRMGHLRQHLVAVETRSWRDEREVIGKKIWLGWVGVCIYKPRQVKVDE